MITEIENLKTKERTNLVSDGVFVFIGMKPNIEMFKDKLELDNWGYIKTDEDKPAVADGTIAAIAIAKELD